MTHKQLLEKSILVAEMPENKSVQLRQTVGGFIMVSPKTGTHFIPTNGELTERVQIHWAGFQQNQSR